MNAAALPFPAFDNAVLGAVEEPGRMTELHLYHGAKCNRACAFCCVHGAPDGAHTPFTEEVLQAAVALTARRGSLKIYGGEPTLDAENLCWTVARLRALGFAGAITVFSNGLRPRVLTGLLDSDDRFYVVLNYAITTGTGEKPLPPRALAHLRAYHVAHPGRLFLSHDFLVEVGRKAEGEKGRRGEGGNVSLSPLLPLSPSGCYRCYPTLTSAGRFHACPFAVEYAHPHFALGEVRTPPNVVQARFAHFQGWIRETLEPEAARQGRSACAVCVGPDPPPFDRLWSDFEDDAQVERAAKLRDSVEIAPGQAGNRRRRENRE